jgi:hypothetical protein
MFPIVVLVMVGCVSVVAARTTQRGIDRKQLVENSHRSALPSDRSAKPGLMTALQTVAVFVPLLFVSCLAIALVRHVLGQ